MEPVIILELDHFANLCGHFYCAEGRDPTLPNCNNGYNCNHPEQEEGTEVGVRVIGSCFGWSCPLGYPPDKHDLRKYGVVDDDGEPCDESEEANLDYIIVSDPETILRLREMGVRGLATRTMEEAEAWEAEHGEQV